jgi:ribosomal protein L16/L10AE
MRFNYPIRRKSKNARMGKGVGAFLRWSTRLKRGYTLIEFKGISTIRVQKMCKK